MLSSVSPAYRWEEILDTGKAGSIADLARKYDVDRSYVGRMLKLTSLAPDIVEAVLRGDELDGIGLEKLWKNLSVRWEEQRRQWRTTGRN